MKINKSVLGLLLLLIPFVFGLIIGLVLGLSVSNHREQPILDDDIRSEAVIEEIPVEEEVPVQEVEKEKERDEIIYFKKKPNYAALFKDMNEEHLNVAKMVGLPEPPESRAEVANNKKLVHIKDNDLYTIYTLRYSSPYLTKGAAAELEAISRAFRDSLRSKDLLEYKLVVTSVLRSKEDVKNLRRSGNANASANSAHCYGTTFDITYTRYERDNEEEQEAFMQPYELTKVLSEVLVDRKKAGKCLVKFERVEHCFHITATY
ncbi:MAG: DUF5715 family protein [Candidatus Cryptobacteroides sp.]